MVMVDASRQFIHVNDDFFLLINQGKRKIVLHQSQPHFNMYKNLLVQCCEINNAANWKFYRCK